MADLDKERKRRVSKAEEKAGLREGHYILGEKFVRIWIAFYPKEQWYIIDCDRHKRSEDIKGTGRKLDDATKLRLEKWL